MRGNPWSPRQPQGIPRTAQDGPQGPKAVQRTAKGSPRAPKGSQREPKVTPKEAKGTPKTPKRSQWEAKGTYLQTPDQPPHGRYVNNNTHICGACGPIALARAGLVCLMFMSSSVLRQGRAVDAFSCLCKCILSVKLRHVLPCVDVAGIFVGWSTRQAKRRLRQ